MTRERLSDLVTAVASDDEADRRLAEHDLQLSAEDEYEAQLHHEYHGWAPRELEYRAWHEEHLAALAAATAAA